MSRRSPFVVSLSSEDRAVLEERASSRCGSHMSVVRARIVLLAADGLQNVDTGPVRPEPSCARRDMNRRSEPPRV